MPVIDIPTPLRAYTDKQKSVQVEGNTVQGCLEQLTTQYPTLLKHLRDGKGNLRSFVNIYVGDEDIRDLDNESTEVDPNERLTIVPSIAGGKGV